MKKLKWDTYLSIFIMVAFLQFVYVPFYDTKPTEYCIAGMLFSNIEGDYKAVLKDGYVIVCDVEVPLS